MFEWIVSNIDNLAYAFSGVVLTASVIVKLTKNTTDDKVLAKVRDVAERLSLVKKDVVNAADKSDSAEAK